MTLDGLSRMSEALISDRTLTKMVLLSGYLDRVTNHSRFRRPSSAPGS